MRRILLVSEYSGHHGNLTTEAPNQQFKEGNLIYADPATGATATPAGAGVTGKKNFLACRDSQNKAAPDMKLSRVTPTSTMVFEVTAGGAAATPTLIQPGKEYGYAIDPETGLGYLNLADTTNKAFRLIAHCGGVVAPDGGKVDATAGDTNVRVYATLNPAII